MRVLFVHQNFPAQFGHVASYVATHHGYHCTFVTERQLAQPPANVRIVPYVVRGSTKDAHFYSRTFENFVPRSEAVYEALESTA